MSAQAPLASSSALAIGREEAVALARQAWRMSKRAVQLRRFGQLWRRDQERLRRTSAETLRDEQWRRLRSIVGYARKHIPYYRETLAAVDPATLRTADDLARLPILTKDTVRRNFPDRLVAPDRKFASWMLGRTSGSTSESLSFVRPDDRFRRSLYYSVLLRTGGITDAQIFVLSTPICTPNTCSLTPDDEHRALARRLHRVPPIRHFGGMIGLPSTAENILTAPDALFEDIQGQLLDGGPAILIADPVYLGAYARWLRRGDRVIPTIRAVISTYELLTPSVADLLRETFGCPLHTQYGSSEINDIADECEAGRLHVRMDEVLVEAIRDGRPARPGELARAVITDLRNRNMPFLRYDLGDVITLDDTPCPCGRQSQTLGAVHGRASDLIDLGDRLLTPLQADAIFRRTPDLVAYRLVQTGTTRFRIELMPEPGRTVDTEPIAARAREHLGDDARLRFRTVEEIRPEVSNKYRFVSSRVAGDPLSAELDT
ncbi:MAG: hypothetical protein AAGE94_17525 [Acidobacteriota bacterium]